jgi:hypothetical protein
MLMTVREAQCSCGQLKITAAGEPVRISVCHCLACQRRTGSAFGAQARFTKANVKIEGRATEYVRTADSGNLLRFYFCPDCGATVHYRADNMPDVVAIALGAFADPKFPAPRVSVYEERRHEWVQLTSPVERFD